MDDVTIARALHVLGVIHWIGGVAFITLIVLPLAMSRDRAADGVALFQSFERRFSAQVRVSILLVGATGGWMTYRLDLWQRFSDPHFWWMAAMVGLWLIFAFIVFVAEPLLHRRVEQRAQKDPVFVLRMLSAMHIVLLTLAALTAFGAVTGTYGLSFL